MCLSPTHHPRLPLKTEQSSLGYTVSPCWLSILNIAVCSHPSQLPNYPFPSFFPKINLTVIVSEKKKKRVILILFFPIFQIEYSLILYQRKILT